MSKVKKKKLHVQHKKFSRDSIGRLRWVQKGAKQRGQEALFFYFRKKLASVGVDMIYKEGLVETEESSYVVENTQNTPQGANVCMKRKEEKRR